MEKRDNKSLVSRDNLPVHIELKKDLLIKSNALTNACYSLTLTEQKILWAILAQLQQKDDRFYCSEIRVADLAEFCHFKSKAKYEQVKKASINMMKKILHVSLANGDEYYTHWVQSFYYKNNGEKSVIIYQIDERLKDELLQLRKAFTVTHVKIAMLFRSQYTIRFYDFFIQYLKIGKRKFSFQNLAKLLSLPESYQRGYNLKARVIDPAIKEINEVSDLLVDEPQYEKQGRKVVAVIFTFHKKDMNTKASMLTLPQPTEQEAEPLNAEEKAMLARLTQPDLWNISNKKARELIKNYPLAKLDANIRFAYQKRAGMANLGGWLIYCIECDLAGDEDKRKQQMQVQQQAAIEAAKAAYQKQKEEENAQIYENWKTQPLSDFVVDYIRKNKKAGHFSDWLQARNLTVEDVLAGMR